MVIRPGPLHIASPISSYERGYRAYAMFGGNFGTFYRMATTDRDSDSFTQGWNDRRLDMFGEFGINDALVGSLGARAI